MLNIILVSDVLEIMEFYPTIVCESEAKKVTERVEVGKQVAQRGVEAIELPYGLIGVVVEVDPL